MNKEEIRLEVKSLLKQKENEIKKFEEQKQKLIELLSNMNPERPEVIINLENFTVYSDIRKVAKKIEEINIKLDIIYYLTQE